MNRVSQLAVNDQGFAFDPSTGDSFLLNSTGLVVLRGLQQEKDEEALAVDLMDRFAVTREIASRDVYDFISRLNSMQLMGAEQ